MTDNLTPEERPATKGCPVAVQEPPGYFGTHRCAKPTKHTVYLRDHPDRAVEVCGIHRRKDDRLFGLRIWDLVESERPGRRTPRGCESDRPFPAWYADNPWPKCQTCQEAVYHDGSAWKHICR